MATFALPMRSLVNKHCSNFLNWSDQQLGNNLITRTFEVQTLNHGHCVTAVFRTGSEASTDPLGEGKVSFMSHCQLIKNLFQ